MNDKEEILHMGRSIYISGKITGLSRSEYLKRFSDAMNKLYNEGWEVINPALINSLLPDSTTYEQYMQISMVELSFCDAIYMLSNWRDSEGARKEHKYAVENGYHVYYEEA